MACPWIGLWVWCGAEPDWASSCNPVWWSHEAMVGNWNFKVQGLLEQTPKLWPPFIATVQHTRVVKNPQHEKWYRLIHTIVRTSNVTCSINSFSSIISHVHFGSFLPNFFSYNLLGAESNYTVIPIMEMNLPSFLDFVILLLVYIIHLRCSCSLRQMTCFQLTDQLLCYFMFASGVSRKYDVSCYDN